MDQNARLNLSLQQQILSFDSRKNLHLHFLPSSWTLTIISLTRQVIPPRTSWSVGWGARSRNPVLPLVVCWSAHGNKIKTIIIASQAGTKTSPSHSVIHPSRPDYFAKKCRIQCRRKFVNKWCISESGWLYSREVRDVLTYYLRGGGHGVNERPFFWTRNAKSFVGWMEDRVQYKLLPLSSPATRQAARVSFLPLLSLSLSSSSSVCCFHHHHHRQVNFTKMMVIRRLKISWWWWWWYQCCWVIWWWKRTGRKSIGWIRCDIWEERRIRHI